MASFWFKPKRFGYGATPVTWQGWAMTMATVVVVVAATTVSAVPGGRQWVPLAVVIAVLAIAALVIVGRRKTEGGWRWRWGDR